MKIALRRLAGAIARIEAEIEHHRWKAGLPCDQTLCGPLIHDLQDDRPPVIKAEPVRSAQAAGKPFVSVTTFGDAYGKYLSDPTHSWSARTREAYETSRRLATSVIGAETPINALSRSQCRDYVEVLRHLPRNASKRFPKLSPRQAASHARERGDIDIISTANANVCLANLSTFLNWAVNEELLSRNPLRGLRLPDETARKDKRYPFSPTQLQAIFNAPLYIGCVDGGRGYSKPGTERPRNARFWVPLIGLHTGMRLNEICQLDVADVREIDGIWCFTITEASLTGQSDKNLKTVASERLMPLHPTLIDCGLSIGVQTGPLIGAQKGPPVRMAER